MFNDKGLKEIKDKVNSMKILIDQLEVDDAAKVSELKEIKKDLNDLIVKIKVLRVVRILLRIALIFVLCFLLLPANSINIYYPIISLSITIPTIIFSELFFRFYGKRSFNITIKHNQEEPSETSSSSETPGAREGE